MASPVGGRDECRELEPREQPVLDRGSSRLHPAAVIDLTLKVVLALALLGELGIVFSNIVFRSLFNSPMFWTDEAAEMALVTIAFVGGAFAYRRGEHAFIRILVEALPPRYQRVCAALVEFLVLALAITVGLNSFPLLLERWEAFTPILQIRVGWFVLPLIASMLVLAVTAIERLAVQRGPTVFAVGAACLALVLLAAPTRGFWQPWVAGGAAVAVSLGLFVVTVLIGLPVGFAMLFGAFAYLFASDAAPMIALTQTTLNGVGSFVLLAFPFFIFAAMIMDKGGISRRLVRFVLTCVGHFRDGLFHVMVVSMYLVSGLSGSKCADVAAVGSVMRDMLRRERYSLERATAVLAASAVMGDTVPPSIAILVLASVTSLSVGALFIAGLMPAVVMAIFLMALIYIQSRRSKAKRAPRASLRQLADAALGGALPLLMPVILFGGILLGIATPTEVSSFAVVYGLVLAGLIYRELGIREFVRCVVDCAAVSGMILFILAAASGLAWTLTIAQLPHRLVRLLTGAHQSQWVFLLASILLLIVTGSILDGLPALVILAPILMPIASQLGLSQLHYGIVLVFAMGLGAFMPPVGAAFYVCCAVCETTIEDSAREMIPFVVALCLGLLVVALVPWVTLYLPLTFHLGG